MAPVIPAPTKTCKDCHVEKPREEFYDRGLRCKECARPLLREKARGRKREPTQRGVRPKSEIRRDHVKSGAGLLVDSMLHQIRDEEPAAILDRAARWMQECTWIEDDPHPDLLRCLVSSFVPELEWRQSHGLPGHTATGWGSSGAYLPRRVVTQLLATIPGHGRVVRQRYARLIDALVEAVGWEDLDEWSAQYSTGVLDVEDAFARAARLVG